jgi:hypothetical protein
MVNKYKKYNGILKNIIIITILFEMIVDLIKKYKLILININTSLITKTILIICLIFIAINSFLSLIDNNEK